MLAMAHAALTAIEIPESQLRAAWERVRRDNWPATYEEAMADAVLGRLVRMNALHPHAPSCPTATPAPGTQSHRPAAVRHHHHHAAQPSGEQTRFWWQRDDD
jgi:hypothetical protein